MKPLQVDRLGTVQDPIKVYSLVSPQTTNAQGWVVFDTETDIFDGSVPGTQGRMHRFPRRFARHPLAFVSNTSFASVWCVEMLTKIAGG